MTQEEFKRVYTFLKDRYGIDMSRKKEIVSGRLDNYLRTNGYSNYLEYMNAVEADITGKLENDLVNILSTNHTYFMREFEHFDYLKEKVLPYLKKKYEDKKDISIWCGAASSGEEPYTIAMTVLDFFGLEHSSWDTTVLATDVSTEVLSQAIAGVYTSEQVAPLPDNWKRRYFRQKLGSDVYEVSGELKEQVIFRQFNLMEPFPFRRRMDVIFLRNVMIYFNQYDKQKLLQKIYDLLEPGGYLFIGRTETIDREIMKLELVQPSVFRKAEEVRR